MALALKLHLHSQISSIPFTKLVRSPQTPLFQLQLIQACGLSPLRLKPRRTNPWGFNVLNINLGGGGGGGVDDVRKYGGDGDGEGNGGVGVVVINLFILVAKWLLDPKQESVRKVWMLEFIDELIFLCFRAMCVLYVAMMEIGNVVISKCFDVVHLLLYAVIDFLHFQFVIV